MTITVKFQGILADMLGRKTEQIDLPDHATVSDLYMHLGANNDTARAVLKQTRPFINGQQADRAALLSDGAEVIFMRPIAGGSVTG